MKSLTLFIIKCQFFVRLNVINISVQKVMARDRDVRDSEIMLYHKGTYHFSPRQLRENPLLINEAW